MRFLRFLNQSLGIMEIGRTTRIRDEGRSEEILYEGEPDVEVLG